MGISRDCLQSYVEAARVAKSVDWATDLIDYTTMARMNQPRILAEALRTRWSFEGRAVCQHCQHVIEFWKPPNEARRIYDEMLSGLSPVVEHRCNSHRDPSERSRSRFLATGW